MNQVPGTEVLQRFFDKWHHGLPAGCGAGVRCGCKAKQKNMTSWNHSILLVVMMTMMTMMTMMMMMMMMMMMITTTTTIITMIIIIIMTIMIIITIIIITLVFLTMTFARFTYVTIALCLHQIAIKALSPTTGQGHSSQIPSRHVLTRLGRIVKHGRRWKVMILKEACKRCIKYQLFDANWHSFCEMMYSCCGFVYEIVNIQSHLVTCLWCAPSSPSLLQSSAVAIQCESIQVVRLKLSWLVLSQRHLGAVQVQSHDTQILSPSIPI